MEIELTHMVFSFAGVVKKTLGKERQRGLKTAEKRLA